MFSKKTLFALAFILASACILTLFSLVGAQDNPKIWMGGEDYDFMFQERVILGTSTPETAARLHVTGRGEFTQSVIVGAAVDDTDAINRNQFENYAHWLIIDPENEHIANVNAGNLLIGTGTAENNVKLKITAPAGTEGIRIISALDYSPFNIKHPTQGTDLWRISQSGVLDVGAVPWLRLSSFPSACSSGQYVTGLGSNALICSTPDTSGGSNWTVSGSNIYRLNGNVGIGTTTPTSKFHVVSDTTEGMRIDISGSTPNAIFINNPTAYIRWSNGSYFSPTGIYSGGNNQEYKTYDGAAVQTRLFINAASGNVGIGTSTPSEKLEVTGKIKVGNNTVSGENVTFDGSTAAGLRLQNSSGYVSLTPLNTGWAHLYTDRSRFIFNTEVQIIGGILNAYNNTDLRLGTASNGEKMRITAGGNVGINTTTPAYRLQVFGGTGDVINSSGGQISGLPSVQTEPDQAVSRKYLHDNFGPGSDSLWTGSLGGNIYNANSGNVGIGTTTPAHKLTINGKLFVDGSGEFTKSVLIGKGSGDVNLNGSINATDMLLLTQYLAGISELNDAQKAEADVDGDNDITFRDVALIASSAAPGGVLRPEAATFRAHAIMPNGASNDSYGFKIGNLEMITSDNWSTYQAGISIRNDFPAVFRGFIGIGTNDPISPLDVSRVMRMDTTHTSRRGTTLNILPNVFIPSGIPGADLVTGIRVRETIASSTIGVPQIQRNIGVSIDESSSGSFANVNLLLGNNSDVFDDFGNFSIYSKSLRNSYFAGNIGIGTTTPSSKLHIKSSTSTEGLRIISSDFSPLVVRNTADSNDLFRLTESGDVSIGNDLFVTNEVTATAYYYFSDRKLKTNITPLSNGLRVIRQLQPVAFAWLDGSGSSQGFLAQDLEKVLPQLVKTDDKTGLKSVQYGNLTAVLVAGMKEQDKKIEKLETEIEILKTKLDSLVK